MPCVVEADTTLASPRFAPWRLFDKNTTDEESRWASGRSSEPHWVALSFPKPIAIDRVVVYCQERPDLVLRSAAVQVQEPDGWRTVASVESNTRSPVAFAFPRCETKAVRLWITDACERDSTARLFEIELYNGDKLVPLAVSRPGVVVQPRIDDQVLLRSVRPLPDSLFPRPEETTRNGRLLAAYRRAMARWGEVLRERIEPIADRPGEAFYGRPGHREDDVRPIGYAVMVNGLLWRMDKKPQQRDDALAALRYLTASHVTGPSTCLDGKQWGDAWQSAMWTRAAGVGAWALWEEMDGEFQLRSARMIEHEADRFLSQSPKSSVNRDTGAEENAWNALIVTLATNMMPTHPRAASWNEAAKLYMYNVFSVTADEENASLGDDDRSVKDWVTTINAHGDYTVENHGLVHIGYQKTSIAQLLENAVHYQAVGQCPPAACLHHVADATELLYHCADWDGAPVYFGGNDWKTIYSQPTDLPIYAFLSMMADDRRAALLEQQALEMVARLQASEDGYFNVRRDIEYGGLCATRLAACYLGHAAAGAGAEPLPIDEFDRETTGVWRLDEGRAILHRTPAKFASFAFGPKWLALTMPSGPDRAIWPHYASYLGVINGEAPTPQQAASIRLSPPDHDTGFWAVGQLERCKKKVRQDFAFVSPAGDVTIYVQRLRFSDGAGPYSCETGVIGHEYMVGSNRRTLFGRFGSLEVEGVGGSKQTHELASDWLNLGGRIGYVVKRFPESANVVRYHDLAKGTGRVPKLQEWLSLIGDPNDTIPGPEPKWACVVTYPNRSAKETAALAGSVTFKASGDCATVVVPCGSGGDRTTIGVDFEVESVEVE